MVGCFGRLSSFVSNLFPASLPVQQSDVFTHITTVVTKSSSLTSTAKITKTACINNISSKRIPGLISKLSANPETNGLQPVNISTGEYIEGLNLNAFHGRRIAMMGDSTLFYMAKHLYIMLIDTNKSTANSVIQREDQGFANMTLSEAQEFVMPKLDRRGNPKPIEIRQNNTLIEWMGMSGPANGETEKLVTKMLSRAKEIRPEIMVANMG